MVTVYVYPQKQKGHLNIWQMAKLELRKGDFQIDFSIL